ncbi:MAG TPA: FG-GAP-like repeat-containing protein [Pyrinomonadaceae bacterium]|jgi:hypothetical protein
MKIRLAFFLALALTASFFALGGLPESEKSASAQNRSLNLPALEPHGARAVAFGVSPRVDGLAAAPAKKSADRREARFVAENQIAPQIVGTPVFSADRNFANIAAAPMPPPALSVDGITNRMNGEAYGLYFMPSDANGDVGRHHYVQTVNALTRVYDKNGVPASAPFKLSQIFAPLGTVCAARDDGEPVVLYDPLADRWLLSQYCNAFPPFRQMVAVSQTGDPTGAYYIYEFVMPNIRLNDYAKFGVWRDGYYMSTDEFVGSDYAGAGVFAFDRAKLLRGDPTASYVYFHLPSTSPARTGGLLPADLDGLRPPPAGAPNIFAGYAATEYGAAQDAVRLFDFHADFENPQNSTFTERPESPLAVAAFDPTSPAGRADIAQPAPGDFLDSQSDRLMYRVAYRNFGTHEGIVFNQTVRTSPIGAPYRAGVRFYELRRNPSNPAFQVYDQTTHGDNSISRWMAAAAQDHQGNVAFEYSAASENEKPSILYAGRLASEPVGTFRAEETLVKGTGVQTAFGFRWGNFSGMTVDPVDDCTFWMTNQYFSAESQAESPYSWLTRIGKFKYAECAPAPRALVRGRIINAASGQPISGAEVTANGIYTRTANAQGDYGDLVVLPDSYSVEASARGFRTESATLDLSGGQILTRDFSLAPVPAFETPSLDIAAESCAPNNAVDPGETVTVDIGLRNTGARDAANLTATLLPTGGATVPSGAQNYGALAAGGAGAARPFTFTASPELVCGGEIVLTFELKDGAESLGAVEIKLKTGAKPIVFQENFDGVAAPNMPAGWTTAATGAQQNWATSAQKFETAPNSAFSPAPNQVGVNELVSPAFSVASANAELEFRNWYELETTFLRNRLYDGAVLEIKLGESAWRDIEAAGGAFLAGGYDGTIDACCQNPLAGRRGWSGRSGTGQTPEFITSKVRLPAAAAGQTVRLRWRVGTDNGTFRTGQFIDDLRVTDGYVCSCQTSQGRGAPFDSDGDRKTDLGVHRPSNVVSEPDFIVENSSNGAPAGAIWGVVGDVPAAADYDGDRKTDYAVYRPSEGVWYVLQSATGTAAIVGFGLPDDRLTPADYDGDARADIAVYRPASGLWYILQSSDLQVRIQRFGVAEDLPVPADYDADGRADVAVFRPSNGFWYVFQSSTDLAAIVHFGLPGDVPVAGDFDGDRRADFVVFRPSNGTWYLFHTTLGVGIVAFGLNEDKPLQADFDGDGRADIAVYRPSTNVWYYVRSTDGNIGARLFGAPGDAALPGIFVR